MSRLFIGGLIPEDASKKQSKLISELKREFESYGELSNVWVSQKRPVFGFVKFKDKLNAADALKEMDGQNVCGGQIRVEYARGGGRGLHGSGGGNSGKCSTCGKFGHSSRRCWNKQSYDDADHGYVRSEGGPSSSNICSINSEEIESQNSEIFVKDKHARQEVLQRQGLNKKNECDWQSVINEIEEHEASRHMNMKAMECPYECGNFITANQLYSHVQSCPRILSGDVCPHTFVGCTYKPLNSADLNDHMEKHLTLAFLSSRRHGDEKMSIEEESKSIGIKVKECGDETDERIQQDSLHSIQMSLTELEINEDEFDAKITSEDLGRSRSANYKIMNDYQHKMNEEVTGNVTAHSVPYSQKKGSTNSSQEPTVFNLEHRHIKQLGNYFDPDYITGGNWEQFGLEIFCGDQSACDEMDAIHLAYCGGGSPAKASLEGLVVRHAKLTVVAFYDIAVRQQRSDISTYIESLHCPQGKYFRDLAHAQSNKIARFLDKDVYVGGDWQMFADEFGFTSDEIDRFSLALKRRKMYSPTKCLFDFIKQKKPSLKLTEVKEASVRIGRNDVAEYLDTVITEIVSKVI